MGGTRGSPAGTPDRGFLVPLSPGTERQARRFTPGNFSFLDIEGRVGAGESWTNTSPGP